MRLYTVHTRAWSAAADGDAVLVKEGFSWPAFFLGPIWALWHGMWRTAVVLILIDLAPPLALGLLAVGDSAVSAVSLAAHALIGLWGNDLRRCALARAGHGERGVVAARRRDEAERRLFRAAPAGGGA